MDDLEARLELPQRAARVGKQQLAGLRREGALADAFEERQAERQLELAYLHAHRGLAQVELTGGVRERAVARDRGERLEPGEPEVHRVSKNS
ncbi:MAG: hypothetical protein AUG87_08960 [Candidatus Rokubacteria bacterium 13_1_20CM_4_70_14]|nr:MAG: hypothetical protein AUG87_08960 [Candidatus Rokubacteria bacterium 13_1_20CM_4_70_14]